MRHYEGFFVSAVPIGAVDPLGDSLFKQNEDFEQAPKVTVGWLGASALVSFRPASFALKEAVATTVRPRRSGWAPLLMFYASRVTIESADPLVPDDQLNYFGDDAAITGGTFDSIGLLPGLGFTLASGAWHVTPIAACGPSWQSQEFTGLDRSKERSGAVCDLRGSMGATSQTFSLGVVGYKTIQTITAETVNVSPTSSSLQIYVSARL